ncbi:MAG: sugar transferase [Alphaproteobacteria bacterium]|nr:sugar transferase [Alphaproteobacteria bacterium]
MNINKRILDIVLATFVLLLSFPIIIISLIAIYRQDGANPLYSPYRVGKNGVPFRMHKMRTMIVGADKNKMDTTGANDTRITRLGHALRKYKLDELPQLFNVLLGQMSFVGPRPQIDREVALYTEIEKGLLTVQPGITDFSSIIFSDLGDIVANAPDPNIAYNQLVRPWKSRLGLFYIEHSSVSLDIALIGLTAVAVASKKKAFAGIVYLLKKLNAPQDLLDVCQRDKPLVPTPPPGSDELVVTRNIY